MPNNNIERDIQIVGSGNYFLHITRVGDKQTAHEKYIDYLREKGGYEVERKTTDGITGINLCTLYKKTLDENGKEAVEQVSDTLFVPTNTIFEVDKYGNFLLKSYFSGLYDATRISHKDTPEKIGSTLVIPSQDKVRTYDTDTVIHAEENGLYAVTIYDDKEKNPEFKFKYNFLNINGEQIRDEHFTPVGFDGTPIIEEVNKPFYKVVDGLHITDDYLLDDGVDEGVGIYPTSYVFRDEHSVSAYQNVASLLIANATTGYPAISDLTPYLQALEKRKSNMDDLYRCVTTAREDRIIDERTERLALNILEQEMDMIEEYEALLRASKIHSDEMGE